MTQLRCCDCNAPIEGLTTEDAEADCPGMSDAAQCERCHQRYELDDEEELP